MKDRATLFLCGDVMTGRGIDQILPFPGDPRLREPHMPSAAGYLQLAEEANGPIPRPLEFSYIWGDALAEFGREAPQAKVINLETAVTRSDTPWQGKEIHYRMNPRNIACLTAAGIDCCVLSNNHILDWGIPGLVDTLDALEKTGIRHAGAGRNLSEARAPAILETGAGRVIVFGLGSISSGIRSEWSALERRPGANVIETQPGDPVSSLAKEIGAIKREGDTVVVSIHWGGNWGYKISGSQRTLAHRLVDEAAVDVVHGHSSHHVKAIEVYNGRLILYGCGDFLNDYEGIGGNESFRGDLGLMYFADVESQTGRLLALRLIPTRVRRFQVRRASESDSQWLEDLLNREGKRFGTRVKRNAENRLLLQWNRSCRKTEAQIKFAADEWYDHHRRKVVWFTALSDGKRVDCGVSIEALGDRYGAYHDDPLPVFRSHRRRIEAVAAALIRQERFEKDGTVLIRNADL